MEDRRHVWAIVLAGGSGSRLQDLTAGDGGVPVPKQFCAFGGGPSLLGRALARALALADPERVVVVVADEHRRWWEPEVAGLPRDNVVIQPCNRGTACGLLLPLAHVRLRDEHALVAVLPSDHYVADERVFADALREVTRTDCARDGQLILLGINPDAPDTGYGWIRPLGSTGGVPSRVVSFVEKPDERLAALLMETGALWNSFTFVVGARTLWALFQRRLPWLVERFALAFAAGRGVWWEAPLAQVYDTLPDLDFARAILERAGEELRVVPVPPCGWTDLGTPERVAACASRWNVNCPIAPEAEPVGHRRPPVDLVEAVRIRAGSLLPVLDRRIAS
jgi:mannose-1-phosphate guanylyltransferase